MKNIQNRLRSKVVWVSVIGLVATILISLGVGGETISQFKEISLAICSILTLFGILNDPTSSDTF